MPWLYSKTVIFPLYLYILLLFTDKGEICFGIDQEVFGTVK